MKPDHEYDGCKACWKWLVRGKAQLPRPKGNKELLKTWGLIAEANRGWIHPLDLELLKKRKRRVPKISGGSK